MKPFPDVQKYIEMLEKPSRAIWQKPDKVIRALQLKGSEIVADIGAGSGYFTFRIAKKLTTGKVTADEGCNRPLHPKHSTATDSYLV